MSINVDWSNPYAAEEGEWLKGSFHIHTSPASACGKVKLDRVLDLYAEKGFDFLGISDHLFYTEAKDNRFVFIPSIEWHSEAGCHTGVCALDKDILLRSIDIRNHEELLTFLSGADALTILNHPNWQLVPHYRREALLEKQPYDGIEIYNGVIERLPGYAISTDKWDILLSANRRVLGFASDDSHIEDDIGNGWIMVRSTDRSPASIMHAVKSGNFYCSSGVTISDISRKGDIIEIESENAQEISVIGYEGRRQCRVADRSISFNTADYDLPYVRFELYGHGSSMAWTQPFVLEDIR